MSGLNAVLGANGWEVPPITGSLITQASPPAQANSFVGGATPWAKLAGPNELKNWTKSGELSSTAAYVTQASPTNGPCMFRREGASIFINGATMSADYGNISTNPALAAGTLANKTIAISCYWHRLNAGSSVILRVGLNSGNYVTYAWRVDGNLLIEGWNQLLVSTAEPIGVSTNGQRDFASAFTAALGWQVGAGTFNFSMAIGYMALEVLGTQVSGLHDSQVWLEGIYYGGRDKPRITIGFDIQTNGLDVAKTILVANGFRGYAAVPTANGVPATPEYVWLAADSVRLKALYAAGWDIIQHSVSHNPMGNYSDDAMLAAEIDGCKAQIVQLGCPRGANLFATPNSSSSNRLVGIAKRTGVQWMRTTGPVLFSTGLCGPNNSLVEGQFSMAGYSDTVKLQAFVDLLILYGVSGHIFTHAVFPGASGINTDSVVFAAMMAYIKTKVDAGLVEVVTPSQWIALTGGTQNSVLTAPSRVPLALGASPYDLYNTTFDPVTFVISAGTVTSITYSRNGTTFDSTGQTAGCFVVQPGDRLRITYAVAPTVIQYRMNSL